MTPPIHPDSDPPRDRDTPIEPHHLDDGPAPDEPRREHVLTASQRAIVVEVANIGAKVDVLITAERKLNLRVDHVQRTQVAHGKALRTLTDGVSELVAGQRAASDREADRDRDLLLAIGRLQRGVSQHDITLDEHGQKLTWRESGKAVVAAGVKHGGRALIPATIAAVVTQLWPYLQHLFH